MAKRRRKTPETDVGARIRTYAATYAASGQKERAEGMLQAADMVDQALAGKSEQSVEPGLPVRDDLRALERRVARLEQQMKPEVVGQKQRPLSIPSSAFTWLDVDGVRHLHRRNGMAISKESTPELAKGAASILSAVMGMPEKAATIDEIIALVGLKQTSVRKYVGDLIAAGYAKQEAGRVLVTDVGMAVQVTAWNCYGQALFEWWLGRLSTGENLILRHLHDQVGTVAGLIAVPGIGLKQTSIRKYLGDLQRRRLIVRVSGGYQLAPILREGAV